MAGTRSAARFSIIAVCAAFVSAALPLAVLFDYGVEDALFLNKLYPSQLIAPFFIFPAIAASAYSATIAPSRGKVMFIYAIGILFGILICSIDASRSNRLLFMMPKERGLADDARAVLLATTDKEASQRFLRDFEAMSRSDNLAKRIARYLAIALVGVPAASVFLPYPRCAEDRSRLLLYQSLACLCVLPFFPMRLYGTFHIYPLLFGLSPIRIQAFDFAIMLVVAIASARFIYNVMRFGEFSRLSRFFSVLTSVMYGVVFTAIMVWPTWVVELVDSTFGMKSDATDWLLLAIFPVAAVIFAGWHVSPPIPEPARVKPARVDRNLPEPDYQEGSTDMKVCEVLFVAANPFDTSRLALDSELREIEVKLRASKFRDKVKLIPKLAVQPDDLLQALNQHDVKVVHFSGHGSKANQIVLSGKDRESRLINQDAMDELFRVLAGNIRLVVLNACFTRPQAEAIVKHIDCAVGMGKAIGDDAAIVFAAAFYRALGFGTSIQAAYDQGVLALKLENIPEHATPVLLSKVGVNPANIFLVE